MDFLKQYRTREYRRKYRNMHYTPIPIDVRWKALILTMKSGEWMTIGYIQEQTGFSRKRVKNMLKKGIQAGIIEKTFEEEWQQPPKNRAYHSKGAGWLYRKRAYYRLDLSKIKITIK